MFIKTRHYFLILMMMMAIFTTSIAFDSSRFMIATAQNNNYLQQGKTYYDRGQYTEAVRVWQRVANKDRAVEDRILGYNYLAIVYQDLGRWEESVKAIDDALKLLVNNNNSFLYAQVLNTKGSLLYKTGKTDRALEVWAETEIIYRDLNEIEPLLRSQINQAQGLRTLGFYRRSKTILYRADRDLNELPDSVLKAKALQSLGVTLRAMGDLAESEIALERSLDIARQLNASINIESIQLSLANTVKARKDDETAREIYQQIREETNNKQIKIEASLNLLALAIANKKTDIALGLFPELKSELNSLAPSLNKIYFQINLAHSAIEILKDESHSRSERKLCRIRAGYCSPTSKHFPTAIEDILTTAKKEAEKLYGDSVKASVIGELGYFYEQQQQLTKALKLTQQAIILAQNSRATDIVANWYWQTGRILKIQGKTQEAITAYQQAIDTLKLLRQDLVAIATELRFDYRDEVEPLYRQYVQLLLTDVDSLPPQTKQEHLRKSREAIEALQLAELENYFREACVVYQPKEIETIDPEAAVIYPILLEDRLEVILSLPNQPLQHYGNSLTPTQKTQIFRNINQTLNPVFLPNEVLPPAQQLYDWLIRPGKVTLERNIKTIVFVLDDWLRNLPMSVLHDGKQYLIEQYNVALAPGLQLLASSSNSEEKDTLTGGLTIARQGFSPLPSVKQELQQVSELLPTQILIDNEFTRTDLKTQIEQNAYSTVHLATHGQFSSQAENTFLLTWADRINVKDLGNLLQYSDRTLELLVLSACETASGDNRAALGMAGVAVRSGARSTIATLWAVRDNSTALLISEFYRGLIESKLTKAEALRQAQLSLLNHPQYNHPYYWSPFVLIGNWR